MTGPARRLRSALGRAAREAALHPAILRARLGRDDAPRAMFFPSSSREGASMLRGYNIAEHLNGAGWRAVTVPKHLTLGQRARLVRLFDPDILVFQQCRHPLNDGALAFGRPYVLDIDDADFHDPALTGKLARTCAGARGVIAGSRYINRWCARHCADTRTIWTGSPITRGARPPHAARQRMGAGGLPILTWAQSSPVGYPAELDFVVRLHAALTRAGARFVLRLYGVEDDAQRALLRRRFGPDAALELLPLMPYDAFLVSLRETALGLSPIIRASPFSRGKSFGKILGYLDARVPAIVSDEADHALFFTERSGVVSNDPEIWTQAALALLADPARREAMADAAFRDMEARLTTRAAGTRADRFLRGLIGA